MAVEIDLDAAARAVPGIARPASDRPVRGRDQRHQPTGRRRHRGAGDVPGDPRLRRAVRRQRGGARGGVRERAQRRARRARGAAAPPARAGRAAGDVVGAVRGAQHPGRRTRRAAHGAVRRRRCRSRSSSGGRSSSPACDLLADVGPEPPDHTFPDAAARPPGRLGDPARRPRPRPRATPRCRTTGRPHHFELDVGPQRRAFDYLFAHGLCTMAMCTPGGGRRWSPTVTRRGCGGSRCGSHHRPRLDEDLTVDVYDAGATEGPACTRSRRRARAWP